MIRRIIGALLLLFSATLFSWVGYNRFIQMQPEAAGKPMLPALVFAAAAAWVGYHKLRGRWGP
jgi:hypothetical protein